MDRGGGRLDLLTGVVELAYEPAGIASHDDVWTNRRRDNTAGADECAATDVGHDNGALSNPDVLTDLDLLQTCGVGGSPPALGCPRMLGAAAQHADAAAHQSSGAHAGEADNRVRADV